MLKKYMPRQIVHYNPELKALAKQLRKSGTLFCPELRLIIEIDGETHIDKGEQDRKRQERLESLGFHVLRFDDLDIKNQLDDVLLAIKNWINTPRRRLRRHPSLEGIS